ncbi:protein ALP1-like [Ischnura elegans]|uniref:protein ALP1-like n=1 Tax=Ischnura elegans TaxID=197161 RepID=UPI001ED87724|nr:protein ALP1-like [Ischnura elegans]
MTFIDASAGRADGFTEYLKSQKPVAVHVKCRTNYTRSSTIASFSSQIEGDVASTSKAPNTAAEWEVIAQDFQKFWNFPHCMGALDGKHINFRAARADGSTFFNYKHAHSIILMALVDANYRFLYYDVGVNGRVNDAGVFRDCSLRAALTSNRLDVPPGKPLPGRQRDTPYVIVGDDAFPLQPYLMKPYPERGLSQSQRVFNYRLSRARRVVENAFGILSNRFRIFLSPINLSVEKVEKITLACLALHNFLRTKKDTSYVCSGLVDEETADGLLIPGMWRNDPRLHNPLVRQGGNRAHNSALVIREEFTNYFNGEGQVPWQNRV